MKVTKRQREILAHIAETGRTPYEANAGIRSRMINAGLYRQIRNDDGTWSEVLTDEGRAALA